jgi:hypothetical protein
MAKPFVNIAAVAVVLMALTSGSLLLSDAHSQAMSAHASVSSSASEEETKKLRLQLNALTARVTELEKKAEDVKNNTDDEPITKKFEARLAALESAQAKLQAENGNVAKSQDNPEGMTVTAPFTVVDDNGKPLMRVQQNGSGFSRGAYFFTTEGKSVAYIGATTDTSGRVYVSKPEQPPAVMMWAFIDGKPGIQLAVNGKHLVELDPQSLTYLNSGGTEVAHFGLSANSQKGYLDLGEPTGSKMVEAGVTDNHRGYVLVAPWQPSTTPEGDPSVLFGGRNKGP